MTDLSRPIRCRDDKRPARVLATDLPGRWPLCIAWETHHGRWDAASFPRDTDFIENVPPPQEWRWLSPEGMLSASYPTADDARARWRGYDGEPVRILREGEAP